MPARIANRPVASFRSGTNMPAFPSLVAHAQRLRQTNVVSLFDVEPERASAFAVDAAGLTLDFSRQRLDLAALEALLALAGEVRLPARIEGLFRGEIVNPTEGRPALHTALRDPGDASALADGRPVGPMIRETLARMAGLVGEIAGGALRGATGESIGDVVNLGIGGSHLGPQLVCEALREQCTARPRVHFVSNVDGGDLQRVLRSLSPERTLFILASKSFTTPETALNAATARAWLQAVLGEAGAAKHFLAITANPERAAQAGIEAARVLPMWDWVGGRFSLWSAIGLPIALATGFKNFEALLRGAQAMDQHFRTAPPARNMPVLMALLGLWNIDALGAPSLAVVPYDERLALFPNWLQQLEMESNGKHVRLDGAPVAGPTAPVVWGGVGTNVQHAFFQLLHQGTHCVPVDFLLPLTHAGVPLAHQDALVANCLAQAEALMLGRAVPPGLEGEAARLALHREQAGNQPCSVLTMSALTPETLGALLALYEHKTFVQGVLWGINSFDQWGVELGKQLASTLLQEIAADKVRDDHDPATRAALQRYLAARKAAAGEG